MWQYLNLDSLEKFAKIFSLLAMPLIIGVGGWYFQKNQSEDQLRLEYLKTSIEILKTPIHNNDEIGPLRYWAADTFSSHTDTKLSRNDIEALASSRIVQTNQLLKYDKTGQLIRVLAYPRRNPYLESSATGNSKEATPRHGSIDEQGNIWVWSEKLDNSGDLPFTIPGSVIQEFSVNLSE